MFFARNESGREPARKRAFSPRKSSVDKADTGEGREGGFVPFVQQYIIRAGITSYRAGWMAFTIRDIVRLPYVATYCATRPPLSASGRDTLTRDVKICSKISPGNVNAVPHPKDVSTIIEQSSSNLKNVSFAAAFHDRVRDTRVYTGCWIIREQEKSKRE